MTPYANQLPTARAVGIDHNSGAYTPLPGPPQRSGSDAVERVPSRMFNTLRFRDGRVTDVDGNPLPASA